MAAYRIYVLNGAGKVSGPAMDMNCPNVHEAIERAKRNAKGRALEVWSRERFIGCVDLHYGPTVRTVDGNGEATRAANVPIKLSDASATIQIRRRALRSGQRARAGKGVDQVPNQSSFDVHVSALHNHL
jgi:hypothetical protein